MIKMINNMKRIQPISKERLKKTADIIANNRFSGCRTGRELDDLADEILKGIDEDDDESYFKVISEVREWTAFLGLKK